MVQFNSGGGSNADSSRNERLVRDRPCWLIIIRGIEGTNFKYKTHFLTKQNSGSSSEKEAPLIGKPNSVNSYIYSSCKLLALHCHCYRKLWMRKTCCHSGIWVWFDNWWKRGGRYNNSRRLRQCADSVSFMYPIYVCISFRITWHQLI